jgi:hypothetical protein
MPRYRMLVLSRPLPGREAEYNDWYQNVHLGQVLAFEGFESAQRLRLARSMAGGEPHPYGAIYQIDTDDLAGLLQQVQASAGSERLQISEALDTASAFAAIYEEFGPAVRKA